MDDKFIKYTKLYALIFLLFLCIPITIAFIVGVFYGFSKLVFSKPADIIFNLFIISLPLAVFGSVYYIFFRRTKTHPAKAVRIISYILFIAAFVIALFFFISDVIIFSNKSYNSIDHYNSFTLSFLAGNVGLLFLIAIIQAFTTKKEKDWMER
jgi:hypothetical protein